MKTWDWSYSCLDQKDQKKSKNVLVIFSHFCLVLGASKLIWEIMKRHRVFSRYSIPYIFSTKKCLRYYFIFSPKKLLESTKMSKNDNFRSFSSIFCALNVVWEILKNLQIFKRCFTPCLFLSAQNLRWYYFIFSLASLIENAKMLKLPVFNHFPLFLEVLKLFWKHWKNINFYQISYLMHTFPRENLRMWKQNHRNSVTSGTKIRPGKTSFCQYLLWKVKT